MRRRRYMKVSVCLDLYFKDKVKNQPFLKKYNHKKCIVSFFGDRQILMNLENIQHNQNQIY